MKQLEKETADVNEIPSPNDDEDKSLINKSVSMDFILRDTFKITKKNDQILTVIYNSKQRMFVVLDTIGLISWEWKKFFKNERINRVVQYEPKGFHNFVDIAYNSVHNCYFALLRDNSIIVLNKNFEEISKNNVNSRTTLCMIYNPINDELITSSVDGFKFWGLRKCADEKWRSLKQMCNYDLVLKRELSFTKDWIRKMDIDLENCHLYCCTTTDLFIYDFNGNILRHFPEIHKMPITACVYSPTAKLVITGSMDTTMKVWSLLGGLIEILHGHSKAITKIILNPYCSNLIISSSLDGYIKMWCLDTMQEIYELNLHETEILSMGVTNDKYLYVVSDYELKIWSINNFIEFWSHSKNKIRRIGLNRDKKKGTRLLIITDENAIRIFHREKATQITAILPIPIVNSLSQMHSIVYCRRHDIIYVLLDCGEIWIYYTKTNPSTRASIWNTYEIQQAKDEIDSDEDQYKPGRRKLNYLTIQNVIKTRRAIEYGLNPAYERFMCRCLGVVEAFVTFYNVEGECTPTTDTLMGLGLENGSILFCDPLIQNKKYFTLNCSKDPVVEIVHDKLYNNLHTKIEAKNYYHLQYWSLPELEFEYETFCNKNLSSYARLDNTVLLGFENGSIDLVELEKVKSKDLVNKVPYENENLNKKAKQEHKQRIEVIDVCHEMRLFMSCSLDGNIKIWNETRKLLVEINLDESLSFCSFLNSFGDLIVGWKNHLFKIVLARILPQYSPKVSDYESNDELEAILRDDSYVIEEVPIKDNIDEKPPIIDLTSYLHPFAIKITDEGAFSVKVSDKAKKDARLLNELAASTITKDNKNTDTTSHDISFISTVPESFLSTPRENPLKELDKVDLTLTSKVTNFDLKSCLVDLLTQNQQQQQQQQQKSQNQSQKKKPEAQVEQFPKNWTSFPKFGESPTHSPVRTPSPEPPKPVEPSPEPIVISEEVEKPEAQTPKPVETKKGRKRPTKAELDAEMERKLKERMPTKLQESRLKDMKIDSSSLLASGGQKSQSLQKSKVQTTSKTSIKSNEREVNKRMGSFKANTNTSNATKPVSSSKAASKTPDIANSNSRRDSKDLSIKTFDSVSALSKVSKPDQRIRAASMVSTISGYLLEDESTAGNVKGFMHSSAVLSNDNQFSKKTTNSWSSDFIETAKTGQSKINKKDKPNSNDKVKSSAKKDAHKKDIPHMKKIREIKSAKERGVEDSSEELKKSQEKVGEFSSTEDKTDQKFDISKSSASREKIPTGIRVKFNRRLDSSRAKGEQDLTKAKLLFDFVYGKQNLPQRISSANYKLPYESVESLSNKQTTTSRSTADFNSKKKESDDELNSTMDSEELLELHSKLYDVRNNKFLTGWLQNYQNKKKKMSVRRQRAKDNHDMILNENLTKWSYSVNRKNMLSSRSASSISMLKSPLSFTTGDITRVVSANVKAIAKYTLSKESLIGDETRNVKSAHVISQADDGNMVLKKRPKSVSFSLNKMKKEAEVKASNAETIKTKPIIHIQPAYLVSQIEMEEILQEVADRVQSSKSNKKSESFVAHKAAAAAAISDEASRIKNLSTVSFAETVEIDGWTEDSDIEGTMIKSPLSFRKSEKSFRTFKKSSSSSSNKHKGTFTYFGSSNQSSMNRFDTYTTTSHRLSLKSQPPQSSGTQRARSRSTEWNSRSDSESDYESFKKRKAFLVERSRTPSSIPSRVRNYALIKYPEIQLEYQLPNCPEKYLLPIRFPALYKNIITSLIGNNYRHNYMSMNRRTQAVARIGVA